MKPSIKSLSILRDIAAAVKTFHHHAHVLLDIAQQEFKADVNLTYLEIGCYAGATASLMLQRPNTTVITIDTGVAVPRETAMANMERFNVHGNPVHYIAADSHELSTLLEVMAISDKADILFIDGGHSRKDVVSDYMMYERLVPKGGYLVFDDYNDDLECPEIHAAVDDLARVAKGWQVIGPIKNQLGAKCFEDDRTDGNCFVMRRTK